MQRGYIPREMVSDCPPIHDRPEPAPEIRYEKLIATSCNYEMLARETKRLLIVEQEIRAWRKLGFVLGRDSTNSERQFGDVNGRRSDLSAQSICLSGERNRRIHRLTYTGNGENRCRRI